MVEVYFGGALARGLVEAGVDAMADFAKRELAGLLGSSFPGRLTMLSASSWSIDPYARGAYSFAKPSSADMRSMLAAPIDDRLFFAGEACSRARHSTARTKRDTRRRSRRSRP